MNTFLLFSKTIQNISCLEVLRFENRKDRHDKIRQHFSVFADPINLNALYLNSILQNHYFNIIQTILQLISF